MLYFLLLKFYLALLSAIKDEDFIKSSTAGKQQKSSGIINLQQLHERLRM